MPPSLQDRDAICTCRKAKATRKAVRRLPAPLRDNFPAPATAPRAVTSHVPATRRNPAATSAGTWPRPELPLGSQAPGSGRCACAPRRARGGAEPSAEGAGPGRGCTSVALVGEYGAGVVRGRSRSAGGAQSTSGAPPGGSGVGEGREEYRVGCAGCVDAQASAGWAHREGSLFVSP